MGCHKELEKIKQEGGKVTISRLVKSGVIKSFLPIPVHEVFGPAVPPVQPVMIIWDGKIDPESFVYDWIEQFEATSTQQFNVLKLSENIAVSPSSSAHSAVLQKVNYQRNQAKELLATIQNIKTAILNIESDLEKLKEQKQSFESNDWALIKGLFVDNYGGPERSWTAIARNVPLVRMAMTWFFRLNPKIDMDFKKMFSIKLKSKKNREKYEEIKKNLKEKANENKKAMEEEIDKLVQEEQMNPAIANYLKRKIEEFWNWVVNYADWLKKTYDHIHENLVQQKANLRMYMRWAVDAIENAEVLTMDFSEWEKDIMPEFAFKFSAKTFVYMEYLMFATGGKRPDIYERTKPFIPVIASMIVFTHTPERQNYTSMGVIKSYYGRIHEDDLNCIEKIVKDKSKNLAAVMIKAGALTKEEVETIFDEEELKELYGEKSSDENKPNKSFVDKFIESSGKTLGFVWDFLSLFNIELPKENIPYWARERRAVSTAAVALRKAITSFKKSKGMLYI